MKSIYSSMLKRGGMERIEAELRARCRLIGNERMVYSTEGRDIPVPKRGQMRGEIEASRDIRSAEFLPTSGRTKFYLNGKSAQKPRIRVMGS